MLARLPWLSGLVPVLVFVLGLGACAAPEALEESDLGGGGGPQLPPPRVEPRLEVIEPARGLWLTEGSPVTLLGRVTPGSAPVDELSVDGAPVSERDGDLFAHPLAVHPGINLVGLRADAADRGRAVDGRAFFVGPVHPPGTLLRRAARMRLAPEFLDDGAPDLDDLASLAELLFTDPSFLAKLDEPYEVAGVELRLLGGHIGEAQVYIRPDDGVVNNEAELGDVELPFETAGAFEAHGTLFADRVYLDMDLGLSLTEGEVLVTVPQISVDIEGFRLDVDLAPELFSQPAIAAAVADYLEGAIEEQAAVMVSELVGSLLQSLAFQIPFGEGETVRLDLALAGLSVTPEGIFVDLDVATLALQPLASLPLGPAVGSLATPGAVFPAHFGSAPVAVLVDDDVVNQALFASWSAGYFSDMEFDAAGMAGLGADDLPAVFQPLDRVHIGGLLPMTVSPRAAEADPEYLYELRVGELLLDIQAGDRSYGVSVNLAGPMRLSYGDDAQLRILMDPRPAWLTVHAGVYQLEGTVDPASLAALVRTMVPPILGRGADGLPGFPLPTIPMELITDTASLVHRELALVEPQAQTLQPEGQLLLIEGRLVLQDRPE